MRLDQSYHQLDHILINKKWKNSALNCEAYNTFNAICSALLLRANRIKNTKKKLYYWPKLNTNDNALSLRANRIKNTKKKLYYWPKLNTNDNADSTYNNIIEANRIAAANIIPLKPKAKRHIPWEKKKVSETRQKLKELNNIDHRPSTSNKG